MAQSRLVWGICSKKRRVNEGMNGPDSDEKFERPKALSQVQRYGTKRELRIEADTSPSDAIGQELVATMGYVSRFGCMVNRLS
jgi:hypothetical protein